MVKYCNIIIGLIIGISHLAYSGEAGDKSKTSLSVGRSENDFRYVDANNPAIYDFQTSFPVLMLTWKSIILSVGYGKQPTTLKVPSLNMLEATLTTGSNINLFRRIASLNLETSLPVRLIYRYRNLSTDNATTGLDFLNAELGLGISTRFRPTSESKFVVSYSIISSLGGLTKLKDSAFNEIYLSRTTDINFDIKLERFFFNKLGLTLGYSFISQRWTDEEPESFKDVLNSITKTDDIPKRRGQGIYRIGINW